MRVACIQMCSGTDRDANLVTAADLLTQASQQGAELALLPENFSFMGGREAEKKQIAEDQSDSATLRFLSEQAVLHQMTIIGGSLLLLGRNGRLRNSCDVLCNVAAFTATTGRAHWQTLLKARAIENQAYMLAAAQCGTHPDGRETWGHSMIIDPWGEVQSELSKGEGIVLAELSKERVSFVRNSLPSLQHQRI